MNVKTLFRIPLRPGRSSAHVVLLAALLASGVPGIAGGVQEGENVEAPQEKPEKEAAGDTKKDEAKESEETPPAPKEAVEETKKADAKTTAPDDKKNDKKNDEKPAAKNDAKAADVLQLLGERARKVPAEVLKDLEARLVGEVESAAAAAPQDGAKKDDEPEAATDGAAEPEEPQKEPVPPMFYMRDGTRLAGYPEIVDLTVDTAYGKLVIPVSDVKRLRFAAVQDSQLSSRIEALVAQLGNEEFDLREEAMEEIRKVGAPALEFLKKALETDDEEVKSRAETLISELEEEVEEEDEEDAHLTPIQGNEDEVVTTQFTVKGTVLEQSFQVDTRYGKLNFKRGDIVCIMFQEPLVVKKYDIPAATFAGKDTWVKTGIQVAKGNKIRFKASGSITVNNTPCGPEGTSSMPANQFGEFTAGALVAKIGDKGTAFLVGSGETRKVEEPGEIFFAIALKSGSIKGQFQVTVKVDEQ